MNYCFFFVPVKTAIYLIIALGVFNRLSGFYGLISLDYSDPIVFSIHIYSLLSLGGFAIGYFGINNDEPKLLRRFMMFYWFDFVITTITTVYLSVKWFAYTSHPMPSLDRDIQLQYDTEVALSIGILAAFRLFHFYCAYIITRYSASCSYLKADVEKKTPQPL